MDRSRGGRIAGGARWAVLRSVVACSLVLLVPAQGWALCCALGHAGRAAPHGVGAHAAESDPGPSRAGADRLGIDARRSAPCPTAYAASILLGERAPKPAPAGSPPAAVDRTAWKEAPPVEAHPLRDSPPRPTGRPHRFVPLRI